MFLLLMYVLFLFQGGFGLSLCEVGLFIMLLVVCIIVVSIVNGCIIMCIFNFNLMMNLGFVLIVVFCFGVVLCDCIIGNGFLLIVMLVGGFGLGLVLFNFIVFVQQVVVCEYLGIVIVLLQFLCMIGGMLGMVIIGMLVSQMYGVGVQKVLEGDYVVQWFKDFSDFEVLVNYDIQLVLLVQLMQVGYDGLVLLEVVCEVLVGVIYMGIVIVIVVVLVGLWMVRCVLFICFDQDKKVELVMLE